jgi:hypothetical protein
MPQVEENTYPLLDLYLRRREGLLAELEQCSNPAEAASRVRGFVRDLERPYTDLPTVTDIQARVVSHVLGIVAATAEMLTAVDATVTVPHGEFEPVGEKSRVGRRKPSLAVLYLWGLSAACVVGVVLVLLSGPAIIPAIVLFALGALAAAGAASVRSQDAHDSPLPLAREPQIIFSLAMHSIDGKLSAALRAADELLTVVARESAEQHRSAPTLEPDRVLRLLQALGAHRIVPQPEKTLDDLAEDALWLLETVRVTLINYSPDQAQYFEKRPAGIAEPRTLVPALISDAGELVRKGIILVPATRRVV